MTRHTPRKRVALIYHAYRGLDRPPSRTMTIENNDPLPSHRGRSAGRPGQADRRRSAAQAGRRQGRRLQPAPPRGRLCRPVRHRLRPAALDRERRRDPQPAVRRIRSVSSRHGAAARADKLKRLGLSAAKIKSIKEIGKAVAKAHIDLTAVGNMDADQAHAALTALHGVGPWTADIYLLFCLGHADAFPGRRSRRAGIRPHRLRLAQAAGRQSAHENRRGLASLARCGGASAVGLLSCGEEARRRSSSARQK